MWPYFCPLLSKHFGFQVGVNIRCVTCDGTTTNITALNLLDCEVTPSKIKPYFAHPEDPELNIYTFLDPSHMLKLARNALADKRIFGSSEGEVNWKFIENLNELQNEEKLKFANNLSDNHICFQNRKMKVSLAAQTLSSSVANALEFLEQNNHPNFQGAGPTIYFLRQIDKLFDILNSKNIFGRGYKQPIRLENLQLILDYLEEIKIYLDSITIDGIKGKSINFCFIVLHIEMK